MTCPNCRQEYQNGVMSIATRALCQFVKKKKKKKKRVDDDDYEWVQIYAWIYRLKAIDVMNERDRREGEELCSNLLMMVKMIKDDPSKSKQFESEALNDMVVIMYRHVGKFYHLIGTNESLEKALTYYQQAKDVLLPTTLLENKSVMCRLQIDIERIQFQLSGVKPPPVLDKKWTLNIYRKQHLSCIKEFGEASQFSIESGLDVADALLDLHCTIQCERLVEKLLRVSRRAHGSDHNYTKKVMDALDRARERRVIIWSCEKKRMYRALRYDEKCDGDAIVIQGPLLDDNDAKKVKKEKTWTVASRDCIPVEGTPVMCQELGGEVSHLNGKIGEVRNVDEEIGKCWIHFEDADLECVAVEPENLRIVFDLPDLEPCLERL